MKKLILATALAVGTMAGGVANATLLSGVFDITTYSYDSSLNSSWSDATAANVANAIAGDFGGTAVSVAKASFDYDGVLNFLTYNSNQSIPTNHGYDPMGAGAVQADATTTIREFINSANSGGSITNVIGNIDADMTSSDFDLTTLFVITASNLIPTDSVVTIFHDDGVSLTDSTLDSTTVGGGLGDPATPTSIAKSVFNLSAGDFQLIYSAANDNPEILQVDVSPVPLPAAVWLFGSALLGVFGIARRKRGQLAA